MRFKPEKGTKPADIPPGPTWGPDSASDTLNLLYGTPMTTSGSVDKWELYAAIAGGVDAGIWTQSSNGPPTATTTWELKCVDKLVVKAPGLQVYPGTCDYDKSDIIGIGCKGPGVVTMNMVIGGQGAGVAQFTQDGALVKKGDKTQPGAWNMDCCGKRQYAIKAVSCGGWGWTFILVLSLCSLFYVAGGVGYNVKLNGKALGREALPNQDEWSAAQGLIVDGTRFSWGHAKVALAKALGKELSLTEQKPATEPVCEPCSPDDLDRRACECVMTGSVARVSAVQAHMHYLHAARLICARGCTAARRPIRSPFHNRHGCNSNESNGDEGATCCGRAAGRVGAFLEAKDSGRPRATAGQQ